MRSRALRRGVARPDPDLIVIGAGLGTPVPKYEHTRHNAGFWAVDELLASADLRPSSSEQAPSRACWERVPSAGASVILAKIQDVRQPQRLRPRRYLLDRYGVGPERLAGRLRRHGPSAPGRLRLRSPRRSGRPQRHEVD